MVRPLSSLRGSSAEAFQALAEQMGAGTSGSDLLGVAALLRAEPGLRRALTDLSAPTEAKVSLARGLLESSVSGSALELVLAAVSSRWVSARDLADSLEQLGVIATVRSVPSEEAERMADELFVVSTLVEEDQELRGALSDPVRSNADKSALLRGLLEGKALPATIALVEQGLQSSHRSFHAALTEYQKVAADTVGEGVALVRTARALTESEQSRLGAALSSQYDRPIHLNVQVDPDLIGGLRVEIGDDVIEGTVASRLDDARRRIAG